MTGLRRAATVVLVVLVALGLSASAAHADVYAAADDDQENQLWECGTRRVPMGDTGVDVLRCLTFRFPASSDVKSAVLYLDIDAPTNSLQDTDALVVAVRQPFDDCAWAQGAMPGCVVVHGGFRGGEKSLVVDLLNIACDPGAPPVDQPRLDAVLAEIEGGVVHMMLQDDTAVNGGWLDINGASAPTCGTSVDAVPTAVVLGQQTSATTIDVGVGSGGSGGGGGGGGVAAAVVGVGVVAVAAAAVGQQTRVRRARRRVKVTREDHSGDVELDRIVEDPGQQPSVAVGVRSWPDEIGTQTLSEDLE